MPPSGDGPPTLNAERLGIVFSPDGKPGGREWDYDTKTLAHIILESKRLSVNSIEHISYVDIASFKLADQKDINGDLSEIKTQVSHQYLCRLFLQLRTAAEAKCYIVLSENDLRLVKELSEIFAQEQLPLPYPFPDLTNKVIADEEFAAGLINFSPPDALALAAVKADSKVKEYAERVKARIDEADTENGQGQLLSAMKQAYELSAKEEKIERAFEIASWVVKPLHYVPFVGEGLTLAEDAKDILAKWLDRKVVDTEWYLIGARMTEVAIRDYLSRKGNILPN